jgi:hypothetical protein
MLRSWRKGLMWALQGARTGGEQIRFDMEWVMVDTGLKGGTMTGQAEKFIRLEHERLQKFCMYAGDDILRRRMLLGGELEDCYFGVGHIRNIYLNTRDSDMLDIKFSVGTHTFITDIIGENSRVVSITASYAKLKQTESASSYRTSNRYITHCFNCKNGLYSDIAQRCAVCTWLICNYCYVCGCTY